MVEFFEGVSEDVGDFGHGFGGSDDHDAVADLEFETLIGDEVHTGAVHAGDRDSVFGAQAEVGEFLAVDRRFGDEDAPGDEFGVGGVVSPVLVGKLDAVSEECHDGFDIFGLTDDPEPVAEVDFRVGVGHRDGAVGVHHAGDDELAVDQIADILDAAALDDLVGELDGDLFGELLLVGEFGEPLVLLLEVDAQGIADEDHREDDSDDAERICDGVTEGDRGVVDARSVGVWPAARRRVRGCSSRLRRGSRPWSEWGWPLRRG